MSKPTKCPKCGYEWKTKSKMYFVSCPCCGSKMRLKEFRKTNRF